MIYTPTAEIARPIGKEFEAMPGMKKTFLFMPVREGVILQRPWACWCVSCMQASAPGEGTMDSNYRCIGCSSEGLSWKETSVQRSDAAGVANAKARTRQVAHSLRDQLIAHFHKSDRAVWGSQWRTAARMNPTNTGSAARLASRRPTRRRAVWRARAGVCATTLAMWRLRSSGFGAT